jgi:hypothetical protein
LCAELKSRLRNPQIVDVRAVADLNESRGIPESGLR